MPQLPATQVFDILNTINRSADFHAYQSHKAFLPQLQIEGLGELALPLCDAQAQKLIELCAKAPYGKGTQTLLDERVRKVWELDSGQVSAGNQAWQTFIQQTLREYEALLDLQGQTLIAHPYKLLIYEAGSFFLKHQDSEKEDGMIGTMVIALPAAHQGGMLTISHGNQSVNIDFSQETKRYDFQSVLFYADCQHEITPLQSGYRLVLTYNICLKGKRKFNSSDFSRQKKLLTKLLFDWKNNLREEDPKLQLVSLDHQYSDEGFALNRLKGIDRSRADALLYAARQAGCEAYICLLETYELFQAWNEDDFDELLEDNLTLKHFIDGYGNAVDLRIFRIDERSVLRQRALEDEEAFDQDYEGYTGNAGNTLSRWYQHAAVIFWPKKYNIEIRAVNDTQTAIDYLKESAKQRSETFAEDLNNFLLMADQEACHPLDKHFNLLDLILKENNSDLADIYCRRFILAQDELPSETKIQSLFILSGWSTLEKTINLESAVIRTRLLEMLNKIDTRKLWDQHPALVQLFDRSVKESSNAQGWQSKAGKEFKLLFSLCLRHMTANTPQSMEVLLHKQSQRLNAQFGVLPYIELLHEHANEENAAIFNVVTCWLNTQLCDYRQLAEQPAPEAALVEAIPEMTCACVECQEIRDFMLSDKETIELPKLKARCDHLDEQIQAHSVQVNTSINKRRRPYRFVMRKLGADQREKILAHQQATQLIERLDKLISP